RPDWFLADTLALRDMFIKTYGRPRWTMIHGQSMGGHVAIASLELHPQVYQGGFIECGVVMEWVLSTGFMPTRRRHSTSLICRSSRPPDHSSKYSLTSNGSQSWAHRALTPRWGAGLTASSSICPGAICRCAWRA